MTSDPRREAALAAYASTTGPSAPSREMPYSQSSIQAPPSWGFGGPPQSGSMQAPPGSLHSIPRAPPNSNQQFPPAPQHQPPKSSVTWEDGNLASVAQQGLGQKQLRTPPPAEPPAIRREVGPSAKATWLEQPRPGYSVNLSKYATPARGSGAAAPQAAARPGANDVPPVVNWGFYRQQISGAEQAAAAAAAAAAASGESESHRYGENVGGMANMSLNGSARGPGRTDSALRQPKLYGFM